MKKLDHLSEIYNLYDTFIIDLWGVMHNGIRLNPKAIEAIEELNKKKKIIYRSNYRGTKEMDKLLSAFTKKYINELRKEDLIDLEKLLDLDDNTLYNFYNGTDTDIELKNNNINLLFKNFKYRSE